MMHVYIGSDIERARKACEKAKEKSTGTKVRMTAEEFSEDAARSMLQHADMFGGAYTITFDGLLQNAATREGFVPLVPLCAASVHTVFIVDEKVDAATKKVLQKNAAVFELFEENKSFRESGDFTLANAFAQKKRAQAWVAYRKSIVRGEAPEALHGMLFWKVKQLLGGRSAYSESEVKLLLRDLAEMPGKARKRNTPLQEMLEHFILSR